MASESSIQSSRLAISDRGANWLQQFGIADREVAQDFLGALTLVSHNEFERALTKLIVREADGLNGPVALFATREFDGNQPYFTEDGRSLDAVGEGSDLGSEARIAALIRNLSRADPRKYLNHPTIEDMRLAKCRGLFVVDDFIGSGDRTTEFLASMWLNLSLRSWCSLHLISIRAIAYSATAPGGRNVEQAPSRPTVCLERDCPTIYEMPWLRATRKRMLNVLGRYGRITSRPSFDLGYRSTAAALVFEHGCPDNCPSILWAPTTAKSSWIPLFPQRSILTTEASIFPPEITRRDPVLVMIQAGQQRLAASGALSKPGPISSAAFIVMGLAAKGIRSRAALAHATGLSALECGRLLERCIQRGLLTPTLRITSIGAAELAHARKSKILPDKVPSRGIDRYYPQTLRRPVDG